MFSFGCKTGKDRGQYRIILSADTASEVRQIWQRRCRAAAAGAVLKPQGGNCAVLPEKTTAKRRQQGRFHLKHK